MVTRLDQIYRRYPLGLEIAGIDSYTLAKYNECELEMQ